MRNIKDEAVYDPALYHRDRIRRGLGFSPRDRVILFAGYLRSHKGIFELVELQAALGDERYRLLFAGTVPNPDQERLIREYGDRITLLPPGNQQTMAGINLAADLVVLWQDPDVSASHYQMPYKLTDALAMNTPVIANDISELGDLGRQGYLRLVPYGDHEKMVQTINEVFADEQSTRSMVQAGRRLYLRQFSYHAARANFALALHRVMENPEKILPQAAHFDHFFQKYRDAVDI